MSTLAEQLHALLRQRILVMDGAMGAMLQRCRLAACIWHSG